MPTQASSTKTSDSATGDTTAPLEISNEPVVRRRRSVHRTRRSKANKLSAPERERRLKRQLEFKVLLIAVPTLLVIVGGVLWAVSNANPDESMHPKGLIRLSYYMLRIGLSIGAIALLSDWIQKFAKMQKEKREKVVENVTLKRRRSSHRRHRSK